MAYQNPTKRRATARAYYHHRKTAKRGTIYGRKWFLKRAYGISESDYEQMFIMCGGLCEICRRPETAKRDGRVRLLCVDHDHSTKIVRGLLCSSCNRAIGYLGDDPLRAVTLVQYLERHGIP